VGTTGAALTAGEELRPTGSDRALLTRIATMTGGKMRDTLAGVYDDRGARRFAYKQLSAPLLLLGAIALVTGVGARRLGVPDWLIALWARARARRQAPGGGEESRERAREEVKRGRLAALLSTKERSGGRVNRPGVSVVSPERGGMLAQHSPAPTTKPTATTAPVAIPTTPTTPNAGPAERPLTAAERLVQKRRERR
jgi:hypothetical protein